MFYTQDLKDFLASPKDCSTILQYILATEDPNLIALQANVMSKACQLDEAAVETELSKNPYKIRFIRHPSLKLCQAAFSKDYVTTMLNLWDPSDDIIKELIVLEPFCIEFLPNASVEQWLFAFEEDPHVITKLFYDQRNTNWQYTRLVNDPLPCGRCATKCVCLSVYYHQLTIGRQVLMAALAKNPLIIYLLNLPADDPFYSMYPKETLKTESIAAKDIYQNPLNLINLVPQPPNLCAFAYQLNPLTIAFVYNMRLRRLLPALQLRFAYTKSSRQLH